MGFYYFSSFSYVPLVIAYGALVLLFGGLVYVTRRIPKRTAIRIVIGVVFLLLPVGEELVIAWNFGQSCKTAGTLIHQKLEVEGFYDDTTRWGQQLAESRYQFVESRDHLDNTLWRVERADGGVKQFKIDRPTARYHYKSQSNVPVAHKVVKNDRSVVDSHTKEVLARELSFGRLAPWFFVGLDSPVKLCIGKREVRGMLYENALLPVTEQRKLK